LAALGPPAAGANSTAAAAGLIDSILAGAIKSNYTFSYTANVSPAAAVACVALPTAPAQTNAANNVSVVSYTINANPGTCAGGGNFYFTDQSGVIRQNNTAAAGPTDSPLAG